MILNETAKNTLLFYQGSFSLDEEYLRYVVAR